jgi:hypothetical protein
MVEPVSAAAAAAAVKKAVSKEGKSDGLIRRMFGPSADVVGEALSRVVEQRTHNLGRIVKNAEGKLTDKQLDNGSIPLRVVGALLQSGSFCEDTVSVEYLGGVLASAKSGMPRDDRGAKWIQTVTSCSAYDLRLHYLLYAGFHRFVQQWERPSPLPRWDDLNFMRRRLGSLLFNYEHVVKGMDFDEAESANHDSIIRESLYELHRARLIEYYEVSSRGELSGTTGRQIPFGINLEFTPGPSGIQLYMYALGMGHQPIGVFNEPHAQLDIGVLVPDCLRLNDIDMTQ